jgi:hypothetical protein
MFTLCHVFQDILTSKHCVNSLLRFLKLFSSNSNLISQSFLLISDSKICCFNKVCEKGNCQLSHQRQTPHSWPWEISNLHKVWECISKSCSMGLIPSTTTWYKKRVNRHSKGIVALQRMWGHMNCQAQQANRWYMKILKNKCKGSWILKKVNWGKVQDQH